MSDVESYPDLHRSHSAEILDWGGEEQQRVRDIEPGARYGAVSESLRHSVPEKRVCSMFCGGSDCKFCNPAGPKAPWKHDEMVIKGLFSNWVTDNILAMSRPTTKAIEEFDIIDQFKQSGINSVINLQQPGEHVACGFGNEAEGFSYRPQAFMEHGIFYYNFGWKDYGVGSLENIMDMVKVMQFAISEGKVAIHCHAGLGRTGVLIATYLLYANRADPNHVIHYIRTKRKGAIQTRSQLECIRQFAEYLKPLRIIFSSIKNTEDDSDETTSDPCLADFSLRQYMVRQQAYLHGQEAKRLKHVPKIVYCCCQRLLELADRGKRHEFHDKYQDIRSTAPKAFLNPCQHESLSSDAAIESTDAPASNGTAPNLPLHTPPKLRTRESFTAVNLTKRSYNKLVKSVSGSSLTAGMDALLGSPLQRSWSSMSGSGAEHIAVQMAQTQYTEQQINTIEQYKEMLNTRNKGFDALSAEGDAAVVAALMWCWLDALMEPVLHPQDMPHMLMHDDVTAALNGLDKAARGVTEVLFYTVARLLPLEGAVHDDLYCRIISTLTHQNMMLDMDYLHASSAGRSLRVSRTSNSTGLMRSHLADRLLHFFVALTRHFNLKMDQAQVRKSQRHSRAGSDHLSRAGSDHLSRAGSDHLSRAGSDHLSRAGSDNLSTEEFTQFSSSSNSSRISNNSRTPDSLPDQQLFVNEETGEQIPMTSYNSRHKPGVTKADDITGNVKTSRRDSPESIDSELENLAQHRMKDMSLDHRSVDSDRPKFVLNDDDDDDDDEAIENLNESSAGSADVVQTSTGLKT